MRQRTPDTIELDLPDLLARAKTPWAVVREPTVELELEAIDAELGTSDPAPTAPSLIAPPMSAPPPTAPPVPAASHSVSPQEATELVRRAQSLLVTGALMPGRAGSDDARSRFEHALARAERSRDHAAAAARLRARAAQAEGHVERAIEELKRALHSTYDPAAARAIFGELAELYAAQGERSEAEYYSKRAGSERPPASVPDRPRSERPTSAHRRPPPPRSAPPQPPTRRP